MQLSSNGKTILKLASVGLPLRPSELEIHEMAHNLSRSFPVSSEEIETIVAQIESDRNIKMDPGAFIVAEEFRPWLLSRKATIDPFYWDRYETLLEHRSWPQNVLNSLDGATDDLLDLTGDPELPGTWKRRGLVIGDVQSGKTSTYTALSCKAADAGYRLIILLTGTIELLRKQTQIRLDEGFVGLNSSDQLNSGALHRGRAVGVGLINGKRNASVLTSRTTDFNSSKAVALKLASQREPMLLVIKKNVSVLRRLSSWLEGLNAIGGKISMPVLLIDDEADSASINTNKSGDTDPTVINKCIRTILGLFQRSSYIGFTATPFANVFINPDDENAMLGDDLFPADYIYALSAPTNYLGAEEFFSDDDLFGNRMLREISDADAYLPPSHKSWFVVVALPPSLVEATYTFLVANAVRDLRGDADSHRSMLVNVSRFTAVQNQVRDLIDHLVRDIQRDIRQYGTSGTGARGKDSAHMSEMERIFRVQYANVGVLWADVLATLNAAIQPIVVRSVNASTGPGSLPYDDHMATGLRVVAVGGNSLSRGLTLEGLMISYFFRNSRMYDTLMQMGRWFGYRDGYEDLCRLWITRQAADWYRHISEASAELRDDVREMRAIGLTPREFGLRVRAHPDSLLVTAQNKMRNGKTIERSISLSGAGLETAQLFAEADRNAQNIAAARKLVGELEDGTWQDAATEKSQRHMWRNVPREIVARFLKQFTSHPLNFAVQLPQIADFILGDPPSKLDLWDVTIAEGDAAKPFDVAGLPVKPVLRFVSSDSSTNSWLIMGGKKRVGSGGSDRIGLTPQQVKLADRDAANLPKKPKSTPDYLYRKYRDRPLLILYFIRESLGASVVPSPGSTPIAALGLSFPVFDDSGRATRAKYVVNSVSLRQLSDWTDLESDEDEQANATDEPR